VTVTLIDSNEPHNPFHYADLNFRIPGSSLSEPKIPSLEGHTAAGGVGSGGGWWRVWQPDRNFRRK